MLVLPHACAIGDAAPGVRGERDHHDLSATALSVGYSANRLRCFGATPAGAGFAAGLGDAQRADLLACLPGVAGGTSAGRCPRRAVSPGSPLSPCWPAPAGPDRPARSSPGGRLAGLLERRRPGRLRGHCAAPPATSPRSTRAGTLAVGTVFVGLDWLTDLGRLLVCCVAVSDIDRPSSSRSPLYLAGMTASSISVLPGGFGVIEVAMIVTFTAGGVDADDAGPAVFLYRLISCVLVVAIGWVVWLAGRLTRSRSTPDRGRSRVATVARLVRWTHACVPAGRRLHR